MLDGVFFLVRPDGPVVFWVQAEKRGATALPDSNPVTTSQKLHKDDSKLVELFGGQDKYDYWLPRSCYLHMVDNELAKFDQNERPAAGPWTERTIVRTRKDLPLLLGRTVYIGGERQVGGGLGGGVAWSLLHLVSRASREPSCGG